VELGGMSESKTDVPTLDFVDPAETDPTYRVCLFAAPGSGKSCAAASAPGPLLVLSADRPSAYRFARKLHAGKDIREVRYRNGQTLDQVYRYIRDGGDIRTLVIDPIGNVVDQLLDEFPQVRDRDGSMSPDYQGVNRKLLAFLKSLRTFDIHVVLVAHEKVNDSKKGDGRVYPHVGGMTLINKTMAEMDVVAHVERVVSGEGDEEQVRWIGRMQPWENIVAKDGTNALGDRRIADLTRWFEVATEELAPEADDESDLPFSDEFDGDGDSDDEAQRTADEVFAQPSLGDAA
jgi:hypothetical protein